MKTIKQHIIDIHDLWFIENIIDPEFREKLRKKRFPTYGEEA